MTRQPGSGEMEPIAEDAVLGALHDRTNCVVNEQQQPLAGPPAGFISRSKPTTPPINRKIRSFQLAQWGPEEELTLKPHRSRLEREKDAAQKEQEAAVSPRQAAIVHRLVARAIAKAMPPKTRCNRLSMAFPPQKPPEIKKKDDSADAVAQWEQEAARKAAVARTVHRAVGSVLRRHAQLQGDPMQGCVRHTSRLQQDQENQAPRAGEVPHREGGAAKHTRAWGCVQPLGEFPPHLSKLQQEQTEWRRAAALLQPQPKPQTRPLDD